MTRFPKTVLRPRSIGALRRALREEFQRAAPCGPSQPSDGYRSAVAAVIRQRFGVPVPATLNPLILEAQELNLPAEAVADFVGRRFELQSLPSSLAKRSS